MKTKQIFLILCLFMIALLAGCIAQAVTTTPTVTAVLTEQQAPTICSLTAQSNVTVYQRPSTEASHFGTLAAGETVQAMMRTDGGWLGFDPGVAQAANVGVFRLRWMPPNAVVSQKGNCNGLPVASAVSPTACYFMAMADTGVYTNPDESSAVLATVPAGGYSAVTGKSASGWYQLDLQDGSLHEPGIGWLNPADANFNGPCVNLPTTMANPGPIFLAWRKLAHPKYRPREWTTFVRQIQERMLIQPAHVSQCTGQDNFVG